MVSVHVRGDLDDCWTHDGAINGYFWRLFGTGIVAIFSTALFTTVFVRLLGILAVIPMIGILMFLGVPASGGAMPVYMQPGVFRVLHDVLPMPAAVESVRSILYFGADTAGTHLDTFVIWGVVSLLFIVGIDKIRAKKKSEPKQSGGRTCGIRSRFSVSI